MELIARHPEVVLNISTPDGDSIQVLLTPKDIRELKRALDTVL